MTFFYFTLLHLHYNILHASLIIYLRGESEVPPIKQEIKEWVIVGEVRLTSFDLRVRAALVTLYENFDGILQERGEPFF